MDNIDNIIERYQQELMEFNALHSHPEKDAAPVISRGFLPTEAEEKETPEKVSESPADTQTLYSGYDEFFKDNTQTGTLRVQVYAANRAFPISGAEVSVFLPVSDSGSTELFNGITDINGVVDNITLAAPPFSLSQTPDNPQLKPYASYRILITHPQYADAEFVSVPVFAQRKSIQGVELIPLSATGEAPDTTPRSYPEPYFNLRGFATDGNTDNS